MLTLRLRRKEIGPLDHEKAKASFVEGLIEMRQGFSYLFQHVDAARGIIATAIQRGGLTALVLIALLLERNTFHLSSKPETGLSGLAIALSIAGIGITLGALIAPSGVLRVGRHSWIRYMMVGSALSPLFLAVSATPISLYSAAFLTSFFGQSLKVTNDALVQAKIEDIYRGRVFAVYDVLVNAAIVSGAVLAALVLPTSGKAPFVPLLISLAYVVSLVLVLRPAKFKADLPTIS
jgi:MFS family permease